MGIKRQILGKTHPKKHRLKFVIMTNLIGDVFRVWLGVVGGFAPCQARKERPEAVANGSYCVCLPYHAKPDRWSKGRNSEPN